MSSLPKGMTLPTPEPEPSRTITHSDINYSALIRETLDDIDEFKVEITKLEITESTGEKTKIRIEIDVGRGES